MKPKQMKARNEAFQLLSIAQRILNDVDLVGYATQIKIITDEMAEHSKAINAKEMSRRIPTCAKAT